MEGKIAKELGITGKTTRKLFGATLAFNGYAKLQEVKKNKSLKEDDILRSIPLDEYKKTYAKEYFSSKNTDTSNP